MRTAFGVSTAALGCAAKDAGLGHKSQFFLLGKGPVGTAAIGVLACALGACGLESCALLDGTGSTLASGVGLMTTGLAAAALDFLGLRLLGFAAFAALALYK